MTSFDIQTLESDLHRLDLRFASLRMRQHRLVDRLARSIEQNGQLVPVVAVTGQADQWVLVDGYLRIQALRRLARDTAWVELWDCSLSQALLIVLVRAQGRTWEAIEEGAIIQELTTRFEFSAWFKNSGNWVTLAHSSIYQNIGIIVIRVFFWDSEFLANWRD